MKKSFFLSIALMSLVVLFSCANEGGEATTDKAEKTVKTEASKAQKTTTPRSVGEAVAQNKQSVAAEPEVPAGPTTTITFDESTYDFGEINQGEVVKHTYSFTNTGDEPLIISNAKGTCGCTVPTWPKEPIAPGEKGEIPVKFDSKGKSGPTTKRVIITANTNPAKTTLSIKGTVVVDSEPAVSNG